VFRKYNANFPEKYGPTFKKVPIGCSKVTEGQVSSTEVRCRSVSHGKLSTADITSSKVRAAMASNSPFSYRLYCSLDISVVMYSSKCLGYIHIHTMRKLQFSYRKYRPNFTLLKKKLSFGYVRNRVGLRPIQSRPKPGLNRA